ncbi:MAG: hypothetical protein MJE12_16565, partial [Alphaproteobacteria bacterium]|nr:hypothetical protein [Alphaproteobacteria bacterium]
MIDNRATDSDSTPGSASLPDHAGPGAKSRRLGIGGKLLLAFSAIAGLTVIAAVIVRFIVGDIRDNLSIIANRSLPSIVASFRLVEESAQLSASIPHLADAADEQQAEAAAQRIGARLQTIARYTEQL